MESVLLIQKDAVRCISGKVAWEWVHDHFQKPSCKELFVENKILTAPALYIFETIMYFLREGEGRLVGEVSAYSTRQAQDFWLSRKRLRSTEQEVAYAGASNFNKLPGEIKEKRNKGGSKGF